MTATAAPPEVRSIDGGLLLIPLGLLHNGRNTRGPVGDVTELVASIRAQGVLVPIQVTEDPDGGYTVHDGHRRLAAMRRLDLPYAPAIVRRPVDDAVLTVQQLTIQSHHKPLDPITEATALHALFLRGMSREALARTIGHSALWVRDRLALVHLAPHEQAAVASGQLPIAEALAELRRRRNAVAAPPAPEGASRQPSARSATVPAKRTSPTVAGPHRADNQPDTAETIAAYLEQHGHPDAATLVRAHFGQPGWAP